MPAMMLRFEPEKILCAIDLSPGSATVLRWARLFVERYQARLDVVHAEWTDYPPYFFPSQEEELAAQSQQRRAALTQHLARLVRDTLGKGMPAETAILDGYPAEAILSHAASVKPDLIVMGSHGHSGFSRLRLGSVAETVMRTTRIPTLIARTHPEGQTPRIFSSALPGQLHRRFTSVPQAVCGARACLRGAARGHARGRGRQLRFEREASGALPVGALGSSESMRRDRSGSPRKRGRTNPADG